MLLLVVWFHRNTGPLLCSRLIFVSSPCHRTLLVSFLCVRVFCELQPALSVFKLTRGFASCGKSTEVLLMKLSLDHGLGNMSAYNLESVLDLLHSHKGVFFFTVQMMFRSSARLLLFGLISFCHFLLFNNMSLLFLAENSQRFLVVVLEYHYYLCPLHDQPFTSQLVFFKINVNPSPLISLFHDVQPTEVHEHTHIRTCLYLYAVVVRWGCGTGSGLPLKDTQGHLMWSSVYALTAASR